MNTQINSVSISGMMWGEVEQTRLSFSVKGMAMGVHVTIGWDIQTGRMNLHVSRNIGNDPEKKPRIYLIYCDKPILDKITEFAPEAIFGKIFQALSFKKYPRSIRRNMRAVFLDDLEREADQFNFKGQLESAWNNASKIEKRRKRKVSKQFEHDALSILRSFGKHVPLRKHTRIANKQTFSSPTARMGLLLGIPEAIFFISGNGKCYAMAKEPDIKSLLHVFATPEFADEITSYIKEAMERVKDATTCADTCPHNKPYEAYMDEAGQLVFRKMGKEGFCRCREASKIAESPND